MEVQILSKKLVKPSTPTPQNLGNFKISLFDQLVPTNYVHVVLYYDPEDNDGGNARIIARRNHLEHSLSEILTLYYPIAGRYHKDKLLIECNDNGAEFSEAKVNCKLSQVLNGEFDVKQLDCLVPSATESETSPLLLVQFNVFECGGTAIGACLSHRLADAFTLNAFINGWATTCLEEKSKVPCPSFEMSSVLPAKHIPIAIPAAPMRCEAKDVTKRFVFTGEGIRNLKAKAAGLSETKFTRIEVVSALIWKALIQAAQVIRGQSISDSELIHIINLRQKGPMPTSKLPCGNIFGMSIAKFSADDDRSEVQLHDLASQIHNAISNTVMNFGKVSNADDVFRRAINRCKSFSEAFLNGGEAYLFSSWCRFPFYEANFGWGRPAWMSVARIRLVNTVFLLDCKDGEGMEAWVVLEKNRMKVFQQNLEIVGIASQEKVTAA